MKMKIILISILLIGTLVAETNYFSDFRYRYEIENRDSKENARDRQRIRARMGVKYKLDDLEVGIRLASGANSIQSPHQTLGDNDTDDNASFGLDLAYLKCSFGSSKFTFGKTGINLWRMNEILLDGDYSPEGVAYSYSRFGVIYNAGYYLLNENSFDYGLGQDENLITNQIMYSKDFGKIHSKFSIINATLTNEVSSIEDTLEIFNLEPTIKSNSFSTQFKMDQHTLGFDYHITDASEENTAMVVMFRTKLMGHSLGLWYYDIAKNGVISPYFTQDNFPKTSEDEKDGDGIKTGNKLKVGWSGLRFQIGFKLCENINTDVRYYMQTMDADKDKINRIQLNLNVKL